MPLAGRSRVALPSGAAALGIVFLLLALAVSVGARAQAFTLRAPAFGYGSAIPRVYTCQGADVAPALSWAGVPAGARSLALVVTDPDAPDPRAPLRTWVHWVLYDIPVTAHGLPRAVSSERLPAGTREGLNSWGRTGYGGPCPPIGRHRYFFRLYALDTELAPPARPPDRRVLLEWMRGHVLGVAQWMGTYAKN